MTQTGGGPSGSRATVPLWRQRRVQIGAAIVAVVVLGAVALVLALGGDDDTEPTASTTSSSASTTVPDEPVVAPLTGLPDPTGESLTRPALLVKVDNIPISKRPDQAGIEQADVIWEEPVEFTTRLMAVFNSHQPPRVGPVRSTRYLDGGLGWFLGHVPYVFSGGAPGPLAAIQESPFQVFDETALAAIEGSQRDPNFEAPHNLFMAPDKVWAAADDKDAPEPMFTYRGDDDKVAGRPVTRVEIPNDNRATFTWNPDTGTWLRDQLRSGDLQPHMTESGQQVAPTNVIVQRLAGLDREDAIGEGAAWILQGGRMLAGTWERESLEDRPVFLDDQGREVAITPGTTWISVITEGEPRILL